MLTNTGIIRLLDAAPGGQFEIHFKGVCELDNWSFDAVIDFRSEGRVFIAVHKWGNISDGEKSVQRNFSRTNWDWALEIAHWLREEGLIEWDGVA